jgi:hypothetical protein
MCTFCMFVGVSYHRLVNLYCPFGLDGELGRHKGLYWFRLNIPTSSSRLLVLPALKFIVGVTNRRERVKSQVSGEGEVELKCF